MTRKFIDKVSQEQLQCDLERYRKRAIELGASDAKIIVSDMVIIDERVRAKCIYPRCAYYGSSANCPPHALDLDQMRKIIKNYRYGILVRLDVPSEKIAGPVAKEKQSSRPYGLKRLEIVSKIEAEAFHDGYHLALAFGGGSCKSYFCPDVECKALKPGQTCAAPLKARASMEAAGMDVYAMVTRAGWTIYPIGERTPPSEVPYGTEIGLVLIY